MKNLSKILFIGILLLICCASCGSFDISSKISNKEDLVVTTSSTTVLETLTTTTSTTLVTTKESTSTSSSTTTTTTTTTTTEVSTCNPIVITTTEVVEVETEPYVEQETSCLPITESERILLCNLVGREYNGYYVPLAEKAKVVAVVMNRVNSPLFPNSIREVLNQKGQFPGYLSDISYSSAVTESVIQSVYYYFSHISEFSTTILSYEGDGTWNYFK